jgi:hypothetical protein
MTEIEVEERWDKIIELFIDLEYECREFASELSVTDEEGRGKIVLDLANRLGDVIERAVEGG